MIVTFVGGLSVTEKCGDTRKTDVPVSETREGRIRTEWKDLIQVYSEEVLQRVPFPIGYVE